MTKTSENATHEFYTDLYQGRPVRFAKDKQTGAVTINAEDVAEIMGYPSLDDMMSDDLVLDELNALHKETGVFAISSISTQDEDTEDEKFEYFAKVYPEEIENFLGPIPGEEPDPIDQDIDEILKVNSTISDVVLSPSYTEKTIDGVVERKEFYSLILYPTDGEDIVLDKEDLQNMIHFLEKHQMVE